jgi:hypothetical protein
LIVPIEIFLPFIAIAFSMSVIAFLPKTKQPFLLMLAGFMIAFWAIITDEITLGKIPLTSTVSGSVTTYAFTDNNFEFTQYPKILFGLIGSVLFLSGVFVWNEKEEKSLF